MSSIASYASLIVASLDLQLVQDLRAAMNDGVDPGGPHVGPPAGYLLAPDPPQTPQGACEQSAAPAVVSRDVYVTSNGCEETPGCSAVYNRWTSPPSSHGWLPASFPAQFSKLRPNIFASPIQPPWKLLPWQEPAPSAPRPIVKLVVQSSDKLRGSLLDCFM